MVYEPQAVTTLSPGMAGTVKLCVPEVVFVGEVVACGVVVGRGEVVGRTEAMAVTEGLAAAECVCVGEVAGVGVDPGASVSADVGDMNWDGEPIDGMSENDATLLTALRAQPDVSS